MIFITHNVHHAYPVADAFTLLNRGRSLGTFRKEEVSREEVLNMMAGGKELDQLTSELEEFSRADAAAQGGLKTARLPPKRPPYFGTPWKHVLCWL